jgi:TonB family protein
VANAERDAILAKVAQTVSQYLSAERYDDAYEIAVLVARQVPEHSLVVETQTTLDTLTEERVQQSIKAAQDGNDNEANQLLRSALALPGRNPRYFDAIRDSIAEIRSVRESAARDREQRAQLAASDARKAWVERTRSAIAAGNLITPAGASASDLLAERNTWESERAQLTNELLSALLASAKLEIGNEKLDYAEDLLMSAAELQGDPDEIGAIRADLEAALVDRQSGRVVNVSSLEIVKSASPRYPRRARESGQTGWVDVYFTVTMSGETADITVANSKPGSIFDRAAMKAVEQWEFQPVEYRGQTITQRAAARLVFRLE